MEKIFVPGNRFFTVFGVSAFFAIMLWAGTLVEFKCAQKAKLIKQKQFFEMEIQNRNLSEIEGVLK